MSPILIASNPRSGTSMTAGLIARHGVQVGEQRNANEGNPKGGYENKPISDYLKALLEDHGFGMNPCTGDMPEPDWRPEHVAKGFRAEIESRIPDMGLPWFYKNFRILPTAGLWMAAYPEARWVLPVRNRADTLASMRRHAHIGQWSERDLSHWIAWSAERQLEAGRRAECFWFNVDEVWSGNTEHVADMLRFCGLVLDEDIMAEWIDPTLWHNREGVAA